MRKRIVILAALACCSGCAIVHYDGFTSATFAKDVSVKGTIHKPDGTDVGVDVTSNANTEVVKAGIGAGVDAAMRAIK